MRIVIVGGVGGTNVGDSFHFAAGELGWQSTIVDTKEASKGPPWWRSFQWRFLDHRPCNLVKFNHKVQRIVGRELPQVVLTTGNAPVLAQTIQFCRSKGCKLINYSTDDPWNPNQSSGRFLKTLPLYDLIGSPRRETFKDFLKVGCASVMYVPFGYDPRWIVPGSSIPVTPFDVLFVGGGDADRFQYVSALAESGLRLCLAGDYWKKAFGEWSIGHLTPEAISRITLEAPLNLILPRKANRDGHTMRSYEAGAIGGALLVEYTEDHREMYGETVRYFQTNEQLIQEAKYLLKQPDLRKQLAAQVKQRILTSQASYKDRLVSMVERVGVS